MLGNGPYPPEYAIDGTDQMFHTANFDKNQWLQIDVTEIRIVQGLSVQSRPAYPTRLRGIEFRVGLEPVLHTNLQVCSFESQKWHCGDSTL